ncbi:MAG: methylated-DNA--[protein]-cysteine S-methyltransferase, partial [Bacteroidota bacterium]
MASKSVCLNKMIYTDYYESPMGWMQLQCSDAGLTAVQFCNLTTVGKDTPTPHTHLAKAKEKLHDYFSGRANTGALVFDPSIGTPFQQAVWKCVSEIPLGAIRTYGAIAIELNKPNSARAVGAANGKNPFAILVPCHRLV